MSYKNHSSFSLYSSCLMLDTIIRIYAFIALVIRQYNKYKQKIKQVKVSSMHNTS